MLFRYERDTVALLLPYFGVVETGDLVQRLREALRPSTPTAGAPGTPEPIGITLIAGMAQVAAFHGMDPEDAATEWVNRVARALAAASSLPEKVCTLPPTPASSA